jgi:hypothetical protein
MRGQPLFLSWEPTVAKRKTQQPEQAAAAPAADNGAQACQAEGPITKKEAVRRALAEGVDMLAEGVPFIKERFGLDLKNQQFNSYKMLLGREGTGKRGGWKGRRSAGHKAVPAAANAPHPAASAAGQGGPVDLIDKTLDLAQQCGGVAALKRLVDRLADMQRW